MVIYKLLKYIFLFLGDEEQKEKYFKRFSEGKKAFIRSEIGQRIRLRKTPEITFEFDESIGYGHRIDTLLHEINKDGKREE